MPHTPRRRESDLARRRKAVSLATLHAAGLLEGEFAFEYAERRFPVAIRPDGRLELGGEVGGRLVSVHETPSTLVREAVARVRDPATCKTNPSGYDRIKRSGDGVSLNDLREAYLSEDSASASASGDRPPPPPAAGGGRGYKGVAEELEGQVADLLVLLRTGARLLRGVLEGGGETREAREFLALLGADPGPPAGEASSSSSASV